MHFDFTFYNFKVIGRMDKALIERKRKQDNSLLKLVLIKYHSEKEICFPYNSVNKNKSEIQEYIKQFVNPQIKHEIHPENPNGYKESDNKTKRKN